jgi:hypothetical protein
MNAATAHLSISFFTEHASAKARRVSFRTVSKVEKVAAKYWPAAVSPVWFS